MRWLLALQRHGYMAPPDIPMKSDMTAVMTAVDMEPTMPVMPVMPVVDLDDSDGHFRLRLRFDRLR